jgi:VWFA-related protein
MRLTLSLALSAILAAPFPALLAAPQQPSDAISVDVDVVNVLATVRDKRGGLISDLDKNSFQVFEDGKQQDIKYFTRETDVPLTLGLLVDVSPSQVNLINAEQTAATEFFAQVIRPKDLAFLISFGEDAELLRDLTSSPEQLERGLNGLRVSGSVGGVGPGPVPTMSQPRGTVLYDAVYLAANEKLRSEVGRKAIVIISDGVDQGSKLSIDQAIESAQKADAVIYGIEYYDPGFYARQGMFGGGSSQLGKLADQTGGHVFRVDRKHPLNDVFKELQEELRSQYSIGFTPSNATKDGSYRKLDIKTTRKDLKVQARKGYFAVKPGARN